MNRDFAAAVSTINTVFVTYVCSYFVSLYLILWVQVWLCDAVCAACKAPALGQSVPALPHHLAFFRSFAIKEVLNRFALSTVWSVREFLSLWNSNPKSPYAVQKGWGCNKRYRNVSRVVTTGIFTADKHEDAGAAVPFALLPAPGMKLVEPRLRTTEFVPFKHFEIFY